MPEMQSFYVLWTYIANHSSRVQVVWAKDAEDAANKIYASFSDDFRRKAKVYVFEQPPAFVGEMPREERKDLDGAPD